jgi:hypothetical protein
MDLRSNPVGSLRSFVGTIKLCTARRFLSYVTHCTTSVGSKHIIKQVRTSCCDSFRYLRMLQAWMSRQHLKLLTPAKNFSSGEINFNEESITNKILTSLHTSLLWVIKVPQILQQIFEAFFIRQGMNFFSNISCM